MLGKRFDVVIRGGTVVSGQEGAKADVTVSEGRIDLVGRDLSNVSAVWVIDASGKLVLPGVLDAHVHSVYDDDFEGVSTSGV